MALVVTDSSPEPRSWSIGPLKMQVLTYAIASGDTSGSVTADRLSLAQHIFCDGAIQLTAAPTFSNNVVTLAFADPLATRVGTILVLGR